MAHPEGEWVKDENGILNFRPQQPKEEQLPVIQEAARRQPNDPRRPRIVPAADLYQGREGWVALYFSWGSQREAWFRTRREAVEFLDDTVRSSSHTRIIVRFVIYPFLFIMLLVAGCVVKDSMLEKHRRMEKEDEEKLLRGHDWGTGRRR